MKRSTKILGGNCLRRAVIYFLAYCVLFSTPLPVVLATPSGGTFVAGTGGPAVIDQTVPRVTDVTVAGMQSVIQWTSLDTDGGAPEVRESLNFFDDGWTGAAVLNRVSGPCTYFNGDLTADTGMRIFIVNPAGVVFGDGSTVNVTQLIASGLDVADPTYAQFLAGTYEFAGGTGEGVVINESGMTLPGGITAAEGVVLIGEQVINRGIITTDPGGFVVMAAGDRVLLGAPSTQILVELDSVTNTGTGIGDVINEDTGQIESAGGTVVLAAGDFFSAPGDWPKPVRIEEGVGRVEQHGTIDADGTDGDGGSVTLTAGDEVILGDGSLTTADGGVSNDGANGGEVVAYASEIFVDDALVDFQYGAQIQVRGGAPEDTDTVDPETATFNGGLAEISGDHMYFNGTVDATSTPFDVPDPENPGDTITITPEGGMLHVDPVELTLADDGIPPGPGGAAIDTFYEEELEAYSWAGVDVWLQADHLITVEDITDEGETIGRIACGSGDVILSTRYDDGAVNFLVKNPGDTRVSTVLETFAGGNIYILAGSGEYLGEDAPGIRVGTIGAYERTRTHNPGTIRLFTTNGGDIRTGDLHVSNGNYVEISAVASGNLDIDGHIWTTTNNVPDDTDKTGYSKVCLVSEGGWIDIKGMVEVEAHGKEETYAGVHICAAGDITVYTEHGLISAVANTSESIADDGVALTADAEVKVHAGPGGTISITNIGGSDPVYARAHIGGAGGNISETSSGVPGDNYDVWGGDDTLVPPDLSHLLIDIVENWTGQCDDCPVPPILPPVPEPEYFNPIAYDDDYEVDRGLLYEVDGDVLVLIIAGDAGVFVDNGHGADDDPDGDPADLIAWLTGGLLTGDTDQLGSVTLNGDTGGFEYTPPEDPVFVWDGVSDYAEFTDFFTYYVEDPDTLTSSDATVTITTRNYLPVAVQDAYPDSGHAIIAPDAGQGVFVDNLYGVDYDPDGDPFTAELVGGGTTPNGGFVDLDPDGSFTYTPPPGPWLGDDTFEYTINDGFNDSAPTTVTISVTNTAPVAQPDAYEAAQNVVFSPPVDEGVIVGLLPSNADSDADGDPLEAILDGGPSNAYSFTLDADGSFSYTPVTDWSGTDSFTYYVSDSYGGNSEVVAVMLYVNVPPTPPTPPTPIPVMLGPVAPIPPQVELEVSGCTALMAWVAGELNVDEGAIQIWMVNALASSGNIQPCSSCARLKSAATILQDAGGVHVAALAQLINEFASSTAPPTEEQMASIADAIARNTRPDSHYAAAGQYLDALAEYVGILNSEMGFTEEEAIELVTNKYLAPISEGDNVGLAAYIAATLAALL